MSDLTPKQAAFVAEYAKDQNATQAAIRAGYSAKTARVTGAENLSKPAVVAALAAMLGPLAEKLQQEALATAEDVVRNWSRIGTADHAELVRYKRGACRYCHSPNGRYQRTPAEREIAWGEHQEMVAEALRGSRSAAMLKAIPQFDECGGSSYDRNAKPNPACVECGGDGVGRVIVADTDELSPAGRALYAGVKVTRDGIEVKTHDKATALAALAKFHKVAGHTAADADAPQVHLHLHLVKALEGLTPDEREAARPLLARLAGGSKA